MKNDYIIPETRVLSISPWTILCNSPVTNGLEDIVIDCDWVF